MYRSDSNGRSADFPVLEHLLAGGEIVAAQTPSPSNWTAEKRLAASVLTSALVEIRDHFGEKAYGKRLQEDLDWIGSDDTEWPYAFVRLCQLFDLEPDWVRAIVRGWQMTSPEGRPRRQFSTYRHAA